MDFVKKLLLICVTCGGLLSCGGGSGGHLSSIEGTWRGDLLQGVIFCADGTTIAACGGCVVETVSLIVMGDDLIGSTVSARDGDCIFEGERTESGFVADVVSGCDVALASLEFNLVEDNVAALTYRYDINEVPVEPGQISCTFSPSGQITR